ncbi:hypothetical protein, partial [Vibrio sp. 99K-1]
ICSVALMILVVVLGSRGFGGGGVKVGAAWGSLYHFQPCGLDEAWALNAPITPNIRATLTKGVEKEGITLWIS